MKCKSANKKLVSKLAQQIAHYSYLLAHMEPFCFLAIWNFIPAHDKNIVRQEMRVRKREGEEEDVEEIKAGERIEMGRHQAGSQGIGSKQHFLHQTFVGAAPPLSASQRPASLNYKS